MTLGARHAISGHEYTEQTFLHGNYIGHSTIMVRKDYLYFLLLNNETVFDENLKNWDDYEMLLRLKEYTHFGFIDDVLTFIRIHDTNASHFVSFHDMYYVYKHHKNLGHFLLNLFSWKRIVRRIYLALR
jgi:hypothetical protein